MKRLHKLLRFACSSDRNFLALIVGFFASFFVFFSAVGTDLETNSQISSLLAVLGMMGMIVIGILNEAHLQRGDRHITRSERERLEQIYSRIEELPPIRTHAVRTHTHTPEIHPWEEK